MSEEATTTEQVATEQDGQQEATEPTADDQLGDAGKRAIDTERKARAAAEKSAKELQSRLDEIEQANMSELEKAKQAADAAQSQLSEYQARAMRQQVALTKGIPAALVDRLHGDTEDDLNADADALLALINAPKSPKPDPTAGGHGTDNTSSGDWLRDQIGRR